MTKTPEVRFHDPSCLYRVLNEAIEVIDSARGDAAARSNAFQAWFADNFPGPEFEALKPALFKTWNAALDSVGAAAKSAGTEPASPPAFHAAIGCTPESPL